MQTGSGAKNPPWARSNVSANMTGINPQIMDTNAMMTQQNMLPFQQTQAVFNTGMIQAQGGMAMPMTGQMQMNQMAQGQMYPGNVVAYPTPRTLNPNMYQTSTPSQAQQTNEQRVFTGTVTKTHNDFGFVDHDVFYQTSVCAKGVIPKVNDRVLVEATYNPSMPFKWNATRVQILPKTVPNVKSNPPKSNSYNAVPPPSNKKSNSNRRDERRDDRNTRRDDRKRSRTRSRSRSHDRRDSRNRRDSPPRKRPIIQQPSPERMRVRGPKFPLDIQKIEVLTLSQRYSNLYIPSDFFNASVKWGETFPPQSPFSLNNPCAYHIMSKEVPSPSPNNTILEPLDADYRFSAKVMLISMPSLESLYQKCGLTRADEKDKRTSKTPLHPTRLIKFLVGQKGKAGESFAIGGPWSPSLDGEDPQNNPGVLIKTAIRTCKALTGIDLSQCTQWYRMVEFYYWRESSGGKSRLECVVLFLPDVWSIQPSRIDWPTVEEQYKNACESALRKLDGQESSCEEEDPVELASAAEHGEAADKSQIEGNADDSTITIDENDDDDSKPEPSHYSKIDLRTIKVEQLRHELRARNVSCKGIRAQLISRLSKLLKAEEGKESEGDDVIEIENEPDTVNNQLQSKENEINEKGSSKIETAVTIPDEKEYKDDNKDDITDVDMESKDESQDKLEVKEKSAEKDEKLKTEKEIEEEKRRIEKEKQSIKTRYELPSSPHIIVHPSATAKGGKFSCSIATLSLLLDYRITDNKEHSFELFVFAELFNEMLMRDFGFYIYKTLYTLPEKDEKKEKDIVETTEKRDEKKQKEEKDEKNEKRDSRRRDRSRDRREPTPEERVDLPPDPYLLLSLVYFDTARGGVVGRKELHALFMSLGLQLARSQTRAILDRVCHKDMFSYKSLMQAIKDLASGTPEAIQDLPLDNTPCVPNEVPPQITELEAAIANGNRDLLPVFNRVKSGAEGSMGETLDVSKTGVVMYEGRAVEVGALVAGAARWAGARARLEAALEAARAQLKAARAAAHHTQQAERGAHALLTDLTASLAAARARITSLTASSKIFHSTLKSIQSKVEAVVNIKYEDDDVVEIVNGPTKLETDKKEEKISEFESITHQEKSNGEEILEDNKRVHKESDIISSENMDLDDKE